MCKSTCFSDYISPNVASIQFNAKLLPSTDYVYVITDRNGRKISKDFTTDANGLWQIAAADLPDGFLVAGNKFKIEVHPQQDDLMPVYMIVQQAFNELEVEVSHTDGLEKDFIGGNWEN